MNSVTGWDHRRIGTIVAIGVLSASVTMSAVACSGRSSNLSAAPTTTGAPTATAPTKEGYAHRLIGQITAENGSTWTVNARNGTQYTVTITPQTQFGTRRTPSTAQHFPVGSTVHVSGTANGNTITARRIIAIRPPHPASTAPTSPPS